MLLSVSEDVLFRPQHKKYYVDCHGGVKKHKNIHMRKAGNREFCLFFFEKYSKRQSVIKIFAEIEKHTM